MYKYTSVEVYAQLKLYAKSMQIKKQLSTFVHNCLIIKWAHLGMIQGPPDYESGALTNWAIGPKNNIVLTRVAKVMVLQKITTILLNE